MLKFAFGPEKFSNLSRNGPLHLQNRTVLSASWGLFHLTKSGMSVVGDICILNKCHYLFAVLNSPVG